MGTASQYNVQEAKTALSELLERAERGEEIVIARAGVPIVRLELVDGQPLRRFGPMEFTVPDDFDAPLDDVEPAAWA
jgi:antitoxin (DNA-binding transcriptional repressor) of toxin-antitoxin stability system